MRYDNDTYQLLKTLESEVSGRSRLFQQLSVAYAHMPAAQLQFPL